MNIYTLKSCDTCRKALKWLNEQGIAHENHDIRADGLPRDIIARIVKTAGWETALNRRSTTWRGLSDDRKSGVDTNKAIDLIVENPTLMKRPVVMTADNILVGFDRKVRDTLSA